MERLESPAACVDAVIARVGKDIRLGAPLGIGKPNHLLNAFYARAKDDPEISLTIYTALTLQRPVGKSDLEKRFLEPMVERVFGNYPDLDYELDRVAENLPPNVSVKEFYFPPGKFKNNARAQQDYISSNYTHVARDVVSRGINVLVQQVAWREGDNGFEISLSCNPDVAPDMMRLLEDRDDVAFVAQTNGELPFMFGDAEVDVEEFHFLLHDPSLDYKLFGPPKMSVSDADFLIGLYASTLIRDRGELQVGIGALGDAIVYALCLRQQDNDRYRQILDALREGRGPGPVSDAVGERGLFDEGLFAATEMLVDSFMFLIDADIIKRRVYDSLPLQRLLNEDLIGENVTIETLRLLARRKAVHVHLSKLDVEYLVRYGVFREGVRYEDGELVAPSGERIPADLTNKDASAAIEAHCLGTLLRRGAIVHGGFFLGPTAFYQWLRDMPEAKRRQIRMRTVSRINQLYGHEPIDRVQRTNARFVNTGMMVTLSGAVVSDGLEDGTVISGVGGQYNFVSMAHALPDGRSIIQVRSTHGSGDSARSSIVFNYGHTTIPRHLRDIVITEYGIADLRGKTDEEVAIALIRIADSRFQDELLAQAKAANKVRADFELDEADRGNTPERVARELAAHKADGLFGLFPFGTDLTEQEIILGGALKRMKAAMESGLHAIEAVAEAVTHGADDDALKPYMARMGLEDPQGFKENLYKRLLAAQLRKDPRVVGE